MAAATSLHDFNGRAAMIFFISSGGIHIPWEQANSGIYFVKSSNDDVFSKPRGFYKSEWRMNIFATSIRMWVSDGQSCQIFLRDKVMPCFWIKSKAPPMAIIIPTKWWVKYCDEVKNILPGRTFQVMKNPVGGNKVNNRSTYNPLRGSTSLVESLGKIALNVLLTPSKTPSVQQNKGFMSTHVLTNSVFDNLGSKIRHPPLPIPTLLLSVSRRWASFG